MFIADNVRVRLSSKGNTHRVRRVTRRIRLCSGINDQILLEGSFIFLDDTSKFAKKNELELLSGVWPINYFSY